MFEDLINVNNFNSNLVVLKKKLLKPLKITIFWTAFFLFFAEIKPDHKLFKKNYFLKIFVLAELLKCFFI